MDKKINNRTLVIPGKVAVMKGEIEDKLPDWNVVVGTRGGRRDRQVPQGRRAHQGCRGRRRHEEAEGREEGSRRRRRSHRLFQDRHSGDPAQGSRRDLQAAQCRVQEVRHHRRAHPLHFPRHPRGHGRAFNPDPDPAARRSSSSTPARPIWTSTSALPRTTAQS